MLIPVQEPQDGWTPEERFFLKSVVISLYRSIGDPVDRFIIIAVYESGYTQTEIAEILGISQAAVNHRLTKTLEEIRLRRKLEQI